MGRRCSTLTQFLIESRRNHPNASGSLNALILDIADATKAIAARLARGALDDQAESENALAIDDFCNREFIEATQWNANIAAIVSEDMDDIYHPPEECSRGSYLLLVDPLDGSRNIDVNASMGSVFSILRAPNGEDEAQLTDFYQNGSEQVAAGYAIYGSSTMFVLSLGVGVYGFTLDPQSGDFRLSHPQITIPADSHALAINAANSRFWAPPVRRYVDECLAGNSGPRGKDFTMRWVASIVAETHRILMHGGVFLYPRDHEGSFDQGRLRLLYECNPLSLLVEQAGGLASTGDARVLSQAVESIHQRSAVVFGSKNEVELIEQYHHADEQQRHKISDEVPTLKHQSGIFGP